MPPLIPPAWLVCVLPEVSIIISLLLFMIGAIAIQTWQLNDRMTKLETRQNYDDRLDKLESKSHEHNDR